MLSDRRVLVSCADLVRTMCLLWRRAPDTRSDLKITREQLAAALAAHAEAQRVRGWDCHCIQ